MHVDLAGLGVHALDGVGDERNERAVLELQHGARGRVEDPRDAALELGHPTADEIRGEPLSLLELILHEQRLAAQRPRVAHSCEADKRPVVGAGAPLDGAGLGLHEHGATLGQRMARTVDVEDSVQAVGRPHPAGGYEGQSTTSTSTRCPSRTAVALITVRSAATVRPPRPITLPASSSATCSSSTIMPSSSSNDSTLTSSGRSTSDRARYSRSSSTTARERPALAPARTQVPAQRPRRTACSSPAPARAASPCWSAGRRTRASTAGAPRRSRSSRARSA